MTDDAWDAWEKALCKSRKLLAKLKVDYGDRPMTDKQVESQPAVDHDILKMPCIECGFPMVEATIEVKTKHKRVTYQEYVCINRRCPLSIVQETDR